MAKKGPASSELTAVVADDEALARRRILDLLEGRETVRVVGRCSTGTATLNTVRTVRPDVLFLDVQMPGLDGFEVLARLEPDERPVVVFSTAYDEYALAAFEANAVDYLLKPYADERFEESLERAAQALRLERAGDLQERVRSLLAHVGLEPDAAGASGKTAVHLERFAVPGSEGSVVIDATAVDWIEAAGDYVSLHVAAKTYLLRGTMKSLERRLDPRRFLRIHRSTIVQLDRIRHVRSDAHGDYVVVLEGGERLRVGRSYRDEVLERVGMRW